MLRISLDWSCPVNQPNRYITSAVQPGYRRCFFAAEYRAQNTVAISDCADNSICSKSADTTKSSHQNSIVLCIDKPMLVPSGGEAKKNSQPDLLTDTLHSAIALAEQDPLLQCVAQWLDEDFIWRPISNENSLSVDSSFLENTPPNKTSFDTTSLDVTLCSTESAEHKIGLSFGRSLKTLPDFPAELNGLVQVCEHEQAVSVCMAELHLSYEDQQRLTSGSCVLLPDTFKDTCTLSLFDSHTSTLISRVSLNRGLSQIHCLVSEPVQSKEEADITTADSVEVGGSRADEPVITYAETGLTRIFLQQSVVLDLSEWHSGVDAIEPVTLPPLAGQSVIVQHTTNNAQKDYKATLIEIGTGLAALLDSAQ